MATPDVRDLYERYLQIMRGPSSSTDATQSEPRAQSPQPTYGLLSDAYQADGGYQSGPGVLGGLASPSPSIPRWARALSPPGGVAVGPRGLSAASRLGRWGDVPMPTDSDNVVEIPNPHLERSIPRSTRDFWNAVVLTQQFFRGQWLGDKPSNGDTEDSGASSSRIPHGQQPNPPGSQKPWIVGPAILKEEFERQGRTSSQDQRPNDLVQRPKEICAEAFENGTIGDIFKRWKSNYATGPFDKLNNEPWNVNDCKPGFVSEDCGGKEYERAPPPEVTKVIGRQLVRQQKTKRAKQKA